ncbi:hypothetical protein [Piscinibacter sp.]|jgi:hypothetical protein|uniref:hypothetical protein n=1 Tax=Piscinibacter sp. TaxID=1903157 RepID=UPI00355AB258
MAKSPRKKFRLSLCVSLVAMAMVAGCGGGNSLGEASAPVDGTPAAAPAPSTGSISLAWVAPQTNADGSTLTDLAGFRIYYGTASGSYSQVITISSPIATRYTIENLPPSTYYMVLKAFDTNNNESQASAELSKTIN